MSNTRWVWVELGCTVAIPTIVLMFGTDVLGTTGALLVALVFPLGFAVASMVREGRPSALAVVSLASVALTGGVGLLALDPRWFAVKEAAVPALFGLGMAASARTRFAVVPLVLDRVLDRDRTCAALERSGGQAAFDRASIRGTVEMGLVTAASGVGSFLLARALVGSPTGSVAFTQELGRYTFWSFPAVSVPVLLATTWVIQRVMSALETSAGVPWEELLISEKPRPEP